MLPCWVPFVSSSSGLCTLLSGFCVLLLCCSLPKARATATSPSPGGLHQVQAGQPVLCGSAAWPHSCECLCSQRWGQGGRPQGLTHTVCPQSLGLLPEDGLSCGCSEVSTVGGPSGSSQEPLACTKATDKHAAGNGLQESVCKLAVVPTAPEDVAKHEVSVRFEEGRG